MRVVVDTNVVVSGLLNPRGTPGRVVDLLLLGAVVPLVDDRILAEYHDVLRRPTFGFRARDVDTLLRFLRTEGEHVTAPPLRVASADPADLPFVEVAVAGAADALVTGNARHFDPIAGTHDIDILTPAELLARQ